MSEKSSAPAGCTLAEKLERDFRRAKRKRRATYKRRTTRKRHVAEDKIRIIA